MLTDLRLALRTLRRAPGFVLAAVLCLAVGLGANTAAFSVVDAVALRPLPFPDAARLVDVHETSATELCAGCAVGTSYDGFVDWRREARAFDAMAAYVERRAVLGGGDVARRPVPSRAGPVPERVQGAVASPALFGLLGARPALGRVLVPDDERPNAERVVVLGHELWMRRFGGDSAVVGRAVLVDGLPHVIVGVMAPRFRFPELAELWTPLAVASHEGGRENRELGVVARLRPGVTVAAASAEMATLAARLARAHPGTQRGWTAAATSLRSDMAGDEAQVGWLLLGAVLLVQLVVSANLAGLLLARAAGRWRELAVRAALGAGRARLAQLMVAEVGLLVAGGGALGFLAASAAVRAMAARAAGQIPYWIELRADWRVGTFCVAVAALTVLVVSALVSRHASRPDLQNALKETGPNASATRRQGRLRSALVVGELAMSLVLLAAAGLLTKASLRLVRPMEGADAERLVSADLALLGARWDDSTRIDAAVAQAADRVARLPGIETAGVSRSEFIAGFGGEDQRVTIEGGAAPANASPRFALAVSPGWWRARGLPVVAGRVLGTGDGAGAEPVVVVNAAMAARLWPDASAVGRRVKLGGPSSTLPWRTVVGVVDDAASRGGSTAPQSMAYVPFAQWPGRPVSIVARAASAAAAHAAVPAIAGAVAGALPDEPVERVQTLADGARAGARPFRLVAATLAALAGFAVVVATIGVYGVVAYGAARRAREIGIRMALGATRRDVMALFGAQAARLASIGAALGLAGTAASTRVVRGMLFGADPLDPAVLLAVTALLGGATLLAGYLPARRATRIDPTIALRSE